MGVFLELFFYFIWLSFTGFLALNPRALWNKFGTHFYDHGEPSEFHFDWVRIVCAVLFFIAIIGIFQYITHFKS
ncbi:hypothetical protein [uncultured Brevibacillus sp.]|uniref:hypothetical protein n=1 Tax=uncultured Brevibacillus sp. TaxID=169970 RepID=UPI00259269DE|nr:hypothetical protein [uncultured Brevibacillus sp.]